MGCFWSSERVSPERCMYCGRKAVNYLVVTDNSCEICTSRRRQQVSCQAQPNRPFYGEYRCSCGRFWNSRLSWANSYQMCKRCRRQVYPHTRRELRASDHTNDKENVQEHQKELCQMCQQLGRYCGTFGQASKSTPKKPYSSKIKY